MHVGSYRPQEAEVVNFVYRLSHVVKRLNTGSTVSREELDRLLAQRNEMSAATQRLQGTYPQLPGIFERMSLRLQMLLGQQD